MPEVDFYGTRSSQPLPAYETVMCHSPGMMGERSNSARQLSLITYNCGGKVTKGTWISRRSRYSSCKAIVSGFGSADTAVTAAVWSVTSVLQSEGSTTSSGVHASRLGG